MALVGVRGAIAQGTTSASPAWGAGESRTAENWLVCWTAVHKDGTVASTPSGWTRVVDGVRPGILSVSIFYKQATGGDTAPSFTVSGAFSVAAQLAEFSELADVPLDRTGSASAVGSSVVVTTDGTDAGVGELVIYAGAAWTTLATPNTAHTVNNSDEHDDDNDATPTNYHYNFGWGTTTTNASADSDTFTATNVIVGMGVAAALVSFKPGVTYEDTPTLELKISETLVEQWDNLNREDNPTLQLKISVNPGEVYPNYLDAPTLELNTWFCYGIGSLFPDTVYPGDLYPGLGVWEEYSYEDAPNMVLTIRVVASEFQIAEHALLVRERPPLRLAIDIANPDGGVYRWAADEWKSENRPASLNFSATMPGGYEQLEATLARAPGNEYRDLGEFSTITVRSPGGRIVWQGRLETAPRTSGDQMAITPAAVGWQSALDDRKDAQMIYVARALSDWQGTSVQRRIDYLQTIVDVVDGSVAADDTTGYPALGITFEGTWSRSKVGEAWFNGKGVALRSLYAAWRVNDNVVGSGWGWGAALSDDDVAAGAAFDYLALSTTSPSSATITATTGTREWGMVHFENPNPNNNEDGKTYTIWFTCLAVYGDHGLPKQGAESYVDAKGLFASDIIAHAVQTWAPALNVTTGVDGTVQTSDFVIPHASYPDPTTASEIIRDVTKYGLEDWAVFNDADGEPTFYWAPRGYFGRRWRATVGPSGLSEQGPQVDRLWNSVIVAYQDVTGKTQYVGPITDPDPLNPVTLAGVTRRTILKMGTSTPAAATVVGQTFLDEQKLLSTAGQAKITGYVSDDRGVLWPASYMRPGDQITFTDAADPSYRRIVKTSWDHDNKSCQISLDSPAEGLAALLERLNVVLLPIGF